MRKSLFLALLLCAPFAFAQSILTVAGGGTDEGQLATAIPVHKPLGMVVRNGDLYFVEFEAGRVRRVDASTKRVFDVAGNGGSGFSGDGGPARGTDVDRSGTNAVGTA